MRSGTWLSIGLATALSLAGCPSDEAGSGGAVDSTIISDGQQNDATGGQDGTAPGDGAGQDVPGEDTAVPEDGSGDDTGPTPDAQEDAVITPECAGNGDCRASPYTSLVTGPEGCYCLLCPTEALTDEEHDARQAAYEEHCSGWSPPEGCPAADCLPVVAACDEGTCVVVNEIACSSGVVCAQAPPKCEPPLVPVAEDGCWVGCGYEDTCSCDDGQPVLCDMIPPACEGGLVLAEQSGCYACVDPNTCKPPGPSQSCETADDCTFTPYNKLVTSEAGCYCTACDWLPTTKAHAAELAAAWQEHCSDWQPPEGCPDVLCEDPGDPICTAGGVCAAPSACPGEVSCLALPPDCKPPLIPVPDGNGCWQCGNPKTCSCDDGAPTLCDSLPPECPDGQIAAAQDGCFACVDPFTCEPPGSGEDLCQTEADCIFTGYDVLVTSPDECYCEGCGIWPVTLAEAKKRSDAWLTHCTEWAAANPCPDIDCIDPGPLYCDEGGQCVGAPLECPGEVFCNALPPACDPPLIAVPDPFGCWQCGFPETCSCDDGTIALCDAPTPICGEGEVLAVQNSCEVCVDPFTCEPPADPKVCEGDLDCTWTEYPFPVTNVEECFCLGCPQTPVTLAVHKANALAWDLVCSEWAADQPCPVVDCAPMIPAVCLDGACAAPPEECPGEVDCAQAPPACAPPLIAVPDGQGCWQCGYANTCDCNDGSPQVCDGLPPTCEVGEQLVIQEGCWACVNPFTCAPNGEPKECTGDVFCDGPPPDCAAPLIPVPWDGCWACGYPDTCNCSDSVAICLEVPPTCPVGQQLAQQDGCWACVDPFTCEPPAPGDECTDDGQCTVSAYTSLVESVDDCYCVFCPIEPMTLAEHQKRAAAWSANCTEWQLDNPCPIPLCIEPPLPICENGNCEAIYIDVVPF